MKVNKLEAAVDNLAIALKEDGSEDYWHYLIAQTIKDNTMCDINESSKAATAILSEMFKINF